MTLWKRLLRSSGLGGEHGGRRSELRQYLTAAGIAGLGPAAFGAWEPRAFSEGSGDAGNGPESHRGANGAGDPHRSGDDPGASPGQGSTWAFIRGALNIPTVTFNLACVSLPA